MPVYSHSMSARFLASAAVAGFLLAASSASAQYAGPGYGPESSEQVYVYGPHRPIERGYSGAPVENLSIARPVRYDDLDLRTAWGARVLRQRVAVSADRLCRQLDAIYPTTVYPLSTESQDCYWQALGDAIYQADSAIARARSYRD